ncbi:hypothetical protein ACLB2K_069125 [Fragaria x ananassa]
MFKETFHLLQSFNSLTLGLLAIFLILLYKWSSSSTRSSPPSTPKLPIIGNLHQLGLHPHRSLQALSQIHGNVMLLRFGSVPVLVVSSSEAASEIMKTQDLAFSDCPKSTIFQKLLYNYNDVSTAPYGEYWRQVKGICVSHLLSNKRVHSFRTVREEETRIMMKKIEESMSSSGVVNLTNRFITLTNDVICTIALGRKYSGGEGGKIFNEILGEFMDVNGLDAKLDKVAKRFDEFRDGIIQEHINRSPKNGKSDQHIDEHKDFVDVLLWIQKENMAGFPVGRVSIKALILDMFTAGTDTYTIIDWAMSELLRNPKVMKKLQDEVRGIVVNKREITEDDLVGMHYLQAVMKETLRLHPPVPLLMPRKATQDVKVQGYDIKANTVVIVNAWQIGRDPKSYDNPEELQRKGLPVDPIWSWKEGRGCPGINFAMAVNEIALANLVHKFDWSLPDGVKPRDLDMTESCGLTKRRKYPLKAIAVSHSAD